MVGNFGECVECGTETLRHRGEWDEAGWLLVRILCLLQDQAAMRFWDLARAANAEKAGFWAGIGGYFFIFGVGGRCARWGIWAFGGAGWWQAGCNGSGRRTESSRPFRFAPSLSLRPECAHLQ
jgi:hypothetical protein